MEENKIFAGGGMNQDDSFEYVEKNEYVEAFNVVINGNAPHEAGDVTNLVSTVEILGYSIPAGLNKCIGADKFETYRKAYFFVFNSFGNHQLVEFDYDTSLNTLLFTNLVDSGGINVLPLTAENYVMDIKLVNGTILIFTDSNSEIGSINIPRLKSGGYGIVTIDDFRLIRAQPLKIPKVVYNDDSGRTINLLRGKLFDVRNQYIYLDDEPSTYSSISKRPVPVQEHSTGSGEDVTKNNNLIITIDIGTNRVKSHNIAARFDMLDWFIVKTVSREYILSLPFSVIDVSQERYEAYNAANNTYSFVFYNDGLYVNIDPVETDQDFDNVPQKAETAELVNGNIVAVGGLTEGYERPNVEVIVSSSTYDPNLTVPGVGYAQLSIIYTFPGDSGSGAGDHRRIMRVTFSGLPKVGDELHIRTADIRDPGNIRDYSYTVPFGQSDNLAAVVSTFQPMIPNSLVYYPTSATDPAGIEFIGDPYQGLQSAWIVLASTGTGVFKSIPALKSNSAYQLALQFYDRYGRPFPLLSGREYITKTQSYAQSKGLTSVISWTISSPPPVGAVSYQWLISENTTHQTTLFINGKLDLVDGNYMTININPLKVFNQRNSSSILTYQYSPGDRCTFMYYVDGSNKVWFDSPFIDVEVVSFEIKVVDVPDPDPDITNYILKVRLNSSIDTAAIANKILYIEIYTPKKRVITSGTTTTYLTNLFYEIGEQYNIVNGVYEKTTGNITDGDVYFKTRDLVSPIDLTTYTTYLAEDFNFSDFYKSNYTSYGRAFLFNERDGVKVRKASIRYSDKFVIDSKLNQLNKFYAERIYGDGDGETSTNYGWIRKIRQRDNYLVCLQEIKVGHIPVFNTIVEDQIGQQQAFLSDKLFNKIRYSQTGNIGMGNARECYSESPNGTIYFVDPNNSVPMREGYDGLTEISKKMSKFFKSTIQAAKQAGRFIISYWDNYTKTMVLSTQVASDVVTQVPMDAISLKYQNDYTIPNTGITITQQMTKGVVSFISGEWVITPNMGETGLDTFKFSFVVGSNTIELNACVTILAGDTEVEQFNFIDLIDQELSTLLESNAILIGGINIPVPISIVGGEYRINAGLWTSVSGSVVNGDTVTVRQTSSVSYSTTTTATLTVSSYSDGFDVRTKDDVIPDPFSFTAVTNADLSTLYTSNTVTITGINVPVPISITGGEYQINALAWTSVAGTISNGNTVKVRQTSSSAHSTLTSAVLTVSTEVESYDVTTKPDVTPDPFTFTPVINAEVSTLYESNAITVLGIDTSVPISIVGGEYQKNAGAWVSTVGTVVVNDVIKVRQNSSSSFSTLTTATLTIGGVNGAFNVTTKDDTTPDAFVFTPVTGATVSTQYESNAITVSGITAPSPISIVDGEYQINAGSWVTASGTVVNGDLVKVRRLSSPSAATAVTTTLTIGGVNGVFTITTT